MPPRASYNTPQIELSQYGRRIGKKVYWWLEIASTSAKKRRFLFKLLFNYALSFCFTWFFFLVIFCLYDVLKAIANWFLAMQ